MVVRRHHTSSVPHLRRCRQIVALEMTCGPQIIRRHRQWGQAEEYHLSVEVVAVGCLVVVACVVSAVGSVGTRTVGNYMPS